MPPESLAEVDRLLVDEPMRSLLVWRRRRYSAKQDGVYHRRASAGWDADEADAFSPLMTLCSAERFERKPYPALGGANQASHARLPHDLARPASRRAGGQSATLLRDDPL